MHPTKQLLLSLPDHQFSHFVNGFVSDWSEPPTALQVLEVLDYCVQGSLASGIVIAHLESTLNECLQEEGVTLEDVAAKASWRSKQLPENLAAHYEQIEEVQEKPYPTPEGYSWKTLGFCGLSTYHLYKDTNIVGIITPGTWNDEDLWSALDRRDGQAKRVLRDASLLKVSEALIKAVCTI